MTTSDPEFAQLVRLLRAHCDGKLDQWDLWKMATKHGTVYITITRYPVSKLAFDDHPQRADYERAYDELQVPESDLAAHIREQAMVTAIQKALNEEARSYGDKPEAMYEPSPGQLLDHVHHRIARIAARIANEVVDG